MCVCGGVCGCVVDDSVWVCGHVVVCVGVWWCVWACGGVCGCVWKSVGCVGM